MGMAGRCSEKGLLYFDRRSLEIQLTVGTGDALGRTHANAQALYASDELVIGGDDGRQRLFRQGTARWRSVGEAPGRFSADAHATADAHGRWFEDANLAERSHSAYDGRGREPAQLV